MRHFLTLFFFSISVFAQTPEKDLVALLDYEKNTIKVNDIVSPSVVSITNIQKTRSFFYDTIEEIPAGVGSGVIWDKEGHLVTNFHVVQGGTSFIVSFFRESKQYKATLVGVEPLKDIAVLKVIDPPKNLVPIIPGDSAKVLQGQKAIAIGIPFRFDHSLSVGVVSGLGRKIQGIGGLPIYDMIQTDASINPGNSGGPLVDSQGKMIAMNTIIVSPSGSSSGLGFGVPMNTLKKIVPQLIRYGKVIRPGLGIAFLEDQAKSYYFQDLTGAVIKYVEKSGPAGKAGLKGLSQDYTGKIYLGDTITAINNKKIENFSDLYEIIDKAQIGDTVELECRRDNKTFKKKIRLEAL